MTALKLSGFFAGAVLLASASVAFGSDFNPQPDPPGRHLNAAATGCPQTMTGHGMDRDAASGLPSGKRKAGGQQDARKAGGNDDQPSLACANGKH
jgi:hypothetical protein